MRHIALRSASIVLLGMGGLTLAACGGKPVDLDAGKASFTTNCASCHALAKAGSTGTLPGGSLKVGPDLDDAFRGARQQGFQDSEFEATVARWIEIAPQKPGRIDQLGGRQVMPAKIVVGEESDNVSAYVASVAGTNGESAILATPPSKSAEGTPEVGDASPEPAAGVAPAAPVDGVQTEALTENPAPSFQGPRIVGPWLTLKIRDRRFSRLTPAVAARSFKIDQYVKPGFWIRIDPK